MTLPSSPNKISASQIKSEFGKKPNSNYWKISHYRKTITKGEVAWPVDDGIPTSGTIRFSDFHGKQHNIVIVLSGDETNRDKILDDNESISSTAFRGTGSTVRKESKNIVYIIRTIGSQKSTKENNERNKCALRTGTKQNWFGGNPSGGKILIKLGSGGKIYGAGGDGGQGGHEDQDGFDGLNGNSALGLEVNVESIELIGNNTRIQAGGGGGAGGGGAREDSSSVRRAGGGGGGGGAGLPAGEGGDKTDKDDHLDTGDKGVAGELNDGGAGGDGGNNDGECFGGGGGGGGAVTGNSEAGSGGEKGGGEAGDGNNGNGSNGRGGNGGDGDDSGSDGAGDSDGGNGGDGGYAITRNNGISSPTLLGETNNIKGDTGKHGVS